MKRILGVAALAALALAGCKNLPDTRAVDGTTPFSAPAVIGSPAVALTQVVVGGQRRQVLVVDQNPLYLGGRGSVTWTLPAGASGLIVTLGRPTKAVGGGAPPDVAGVKLECSQASASQWVCAVPSKLPVAVYPYTLSFTLNGKLIELDPDMVP